MKERPIIFSGPMVRAILGGRKTQTRRACKPMNAWVDQECREVRQHEGAPHHFLKGATMPVERLRCPYGAPGDRLWVRETWHTDEPDLAYARAKHEDAMSGSPICYAADAVHDNAGCIWRPSIHMPRWASRITLEIVSVRVERLQEISAKDVLAEGAVLRAHDDQFGHNPVSAFDGCVYLDLKSLWARGWDSINAKRAPWGSNPWVWAIAFRRIDA